MTLAMKCTLQLYYFNSLSEVSGHGCIYSMCTWISLLVKLRQKATCGPIFYLASIFCLGPKFIKFVGRVIIRTRPSKRELLLLKSPSLSRLAKGFFFNSFTYWSESVKFQLFVTVKVHNANIFYKRYWHVDNLAMNLL